MLSKALKLMVLLVFTAGAVGCGAIQMPMTLALDEGSGMTLAIPPLLEADVQLEGGVETSMTADINLLGLLLHIPIFGTVEIDDLLFAGTPFAILGIPTEEVCTVMQEGDPGGGSVLIDLFNGHIDFNMDLATAILIGNPTLADAIPGGFLFTISMSSGADLTLPELLALAFGDPNGVLSITQPLDEVLDVTVLGLPLQIFVTGELTLSTVSEFPSGELLDDCIAFLAE